MKINIAKSAGFCFGVKRALMVALETAKTYQNVYMLGDIVHNEDVVRQIENSGIKKIKKLFKGAGKTLLIRAHGASLATFKKAKKIGFNIIDATCPMVKEIHKIAQDMENNGYKIIVIGDNQHDEVKGIVGQLKRKAIVIDNYKHIPLKIIQKIKRAAIVVQSTQNLKNVLKIVNILKQQIKDLKFFNTICRPTRIKQDEIRRMPLENDIIIIIGSKNSANTKRLFEISKSLNKKTFWIQSKKDINNPWLRNAQNVGITAGASTPDETTRGIIEYLKNI